ncbi:hypothetical protein BDZ97DRAFT_1780768 [Flammula alnicola]|nr:hypothetical protein BDZ97DRAFT_1780768 [Flammula alnicola]
MQPPLDIPSRSQSSSSSLFQSRDDVRYFVGSPDPINSEDQYPASDMMNSTATLPTTPILNGQPPTSASLQRRRAATLQNASPSAQRVGPNHRDRHPEHQWSLFGQLMENEGYLPVSPGSTLRRARQDSPSDYFVQDGGSVTGSSIRGIGSPYSRTSVDARPSRDVSPTRHHPVPDVPALNNYDSVDSVSIASTFQQPTAPPRSRFSYPLLQKLSLSPVSRNILKCAIAYFVASLFTFSPLLSKFISDMDTSGPSASGHMVATIAVYFNPAKTVGAMIEADLFCLFGVLYAAVVCLVSMSMFWFLEVRPGWEWMADFVAIAWIALSMSILAWMKVWMANPSPFPISLCLLELNLFGTRVIKEGGLITLLQVSGIILCGSIVSNLACYLLWPQTAISNLRLSMTKTLDSFSTLLPMLTRIFLLENDSESHVINLEKTQAAVENHQNSFTNLQKNLREAKSEWALTGGLGRRSYEDTVDCLNRLAQHLNGLRSGTRLQYELTKAGIKRQSGKLGKGKATDSNENKGVEDGETLLRAAAAMFGDLVDELGPPLKALSSASTFTLNRLLDVCLESQKEKKRPEDVIQPHEFSDLVDGIEAALVRFESTSNHAVLRLYRRSDANPLSRSTSSGSEFPQSPLDSNNPLTEGDNENVFLVYFFIFTLQEFARELISLVDSVERIYYYEQRMLRRDLWWRRSADWIRRAFSSLTFSRAKSSEARRRTLNIRKSFLYMIPHHRTPHPAFPKIRPHAPDTIQTPPRAKLTFMGKVYQTIWTIGKRLKERDTKYAIKAGMATALLATPAFLDSTRPTFVAYWGDWALISFFVVISPTIGALQRFLGTLFGAAVAVAVYSLFPENAVVLSIFGFLFSIPCFYFAVAKPKYLSASRFVLLTYNLTCLYCYNVREGDVSVVNIGFHRAIAVIAGVLWAAFVSRFWWPAEARRELSKSLSEFLDIRNVTRHAATTRLANSIHEFMAMELHLQIKLIELQSLLAQAQHEPRLKGPFPVDLYRQILISLQTILDKLHSMRCVTTREECVRQNFIVPVNRERREMVGNIMLSFSTLAASFRLKAPLPPYLPPVEKSRLRLVEAIRKLDVVKKRDAKISQQLLFFAYALTMKGVTMELEFLGRTLQNAFGVIGQTSEEFEKLFLPLDESQSQIEYVA